MGTRNDDISLKLAKANKNGFFPNVGDSEVEILTQEANALFGSDSNLSVVTTAHMKLHAAFAQSNIRFVRIVFTGSSSVAGSNSTLPERRFVNRVTSAIQSAYSSGIAEKLVADFASATPSVAAGIEAFNAGVGGTTSATYLGTPPNSSQYLKFGVIQPTAIFHLVGSNDWGAQMPPSEYKANMLASIAAIDAQITVPRVHILLHAFLRTDYADNRTYKYSQYRDVLQEIADTDPAKFIFIDLERVAAVSDYSGSDPYDMRDTDNIHPTDVGHALIADIIIKELRLRPINGVAPAVIPSDMAVNRVRFTSEGWGGGNVADINARSTDIAFGGTAKTWIAEPAANLAINNGGLVRGAGTLGIFLGLFAEPGANLEFGFTITDSPEGNNLVAELHRTLATVAGSHTSYRLEFQYGVMNLKKRIGGAFTTLQAGGSYTSGDRIAFRYFNGKIEVRKNGVIMLSATDNTIPTAGYCGFAGDTTTTGFIIDDITVDTLSF